MCVCKHLCPKLEIWTHGLVLKIHATILCNRRMTRIKIFSLNFYWHAKLQNAVSSVGLCNDCRSFLFTVYKQSCSGNNQQTESWRCQRTEGNSSNHWRPFTFAAAKFIIYSHRLQETIKPKQLSVFKLQILEWPIRGGTVPNADQSRLATHATRQCSLLPSLLHKPHGHLGQASTLYSLNYLLS